MDLRLPLILLCVSTSLSIEDNEMEGHPNHNLSPSVPNISSEAYGWPNDFDGHPNLSPSVPNISSEHYGRPNDFDDSIRGVGYQPLKLQPQVNCLLVGVLQGPPTASLVPFVYPGNLDSGQGVGFPMIYDGPPKSYTSEDEGLGSGSGDGNETTVISSRQIEFHMLPKMFLHEFNEYMNSWWVTKFVPSIYIVVLLVALPLNIMAIIVVLVKVKVKKPAVVYMLNLAAADVLFVSILPFHIVYRFSGNNWLVGEGMCRFVTAMYFCNMRGSILLMTSISVDRFLALVYPVRSLPWRTMRRAWLVCCFIWVISMASTVPILIAQQTRSFPSLNITTCYDVQDAKLVERFHVYYYFPIYLTLFYFLPLIIATFCYIGIICSLRAPNMKGAQKRSRAILLSVVVLCVFVLCFGPTNVVWFMHFLQVYYSHGGNFLYIIYIISVSVSSVSCCLDPLIYYFASSQWQRHVYTLLGCKREQTPLVDPKDKKQETT